MTILLWALTFFCSGVPGHSDPVEQTILSMERRAMDEWRVGNPDLFLALLDPGIIFFHSSLEKKLAGLEAVRAVYEGYRGRPLFDRYEISDSNVVVSGDVAVLTYLFRTENGSLTRRWRATEIYRHGEAGWRIIHSHFSEVRS